MKRWAHYTSRALVFWLLMSSALSPARAVDYMSTRLPQLQALAVSTPALSDTSGNSVTLEAASTDVIVEAVVELSVRIHRNSLTSITILMSQPTPYPLSPFEAKCRSSFELNATNTDRNLQTRASDGDWFIERYALSATTYSYGPKPCPGEWRVKRVKLGDSAGRVVTIVYEGGAAYPDGFQTSDFWRALGESSPEIPCSVAVPKTSGPSPSPDFADRTLCDQLPLASTTGFRINLSGGPAAAVPPIVDYPAQVEELTGRLKAAETGLANANLQLTDANNQLQAARAQVKTLTEESSALDSRARSAQAALSLANAKLKRVCATKPRPKGC